MNTQAPSKPGATLKLDYTAIEEQFVRDLTSDVGETLATDVLNLTRDLPSSVQEIEALNRLRDEVRSIAMALYAGPPSKRRIDDDGEVEMSAEVARLMRESAFYDITGPGESLFNVTEESIAEGEADRLIQKATMGLRLFRRLDGLLAEVDRGVAD